MPDLNEHQFGDQQTLFDAPLGQPHSGTFKGNPAARIYRGIHVPTSSEGVRKSRWGDDLGGSKEDAAHDVLDYASRPRQDRGHDTQLGIHWQHDKDVAEDYGNDLTRHGRHGDRGIPVLLEADHPGHEHIIQNHPTEHGGPPDGRFHSDGTSKRPRSLSGYAKDWSLIRDTVGPHNLNSAMLAEVPVRPGAPMQVHAVHFPDPEKSGAWLRVPVKHKGEA